MQLQYDVEVCPKDPVDLAISFDASAGVPGTEAPPATIWVLDQGEGVINLYDLKGTKVGAINDGEGSSNLFQRPAALAVDSFRGLAYVLDERAQEVVVVDRRGQEWHRVGAVGDRCGTVARQRLLDSTTLKSTSPQEFKGGAEVGLQFSLRRPGLLRAVRFYRAAGEEGPHAATLWRADGRPLAKVSFPDAGAAGGWTSVFLETPLELEAGVGYTVSANVNAWATALTPVAGSGVLDNGRDLLSFGAPGGRVSPVAGQFPAEVASVHYLDVEVEAEPYEPSLAGVGALGALFDAAAAQAQGGGLTYYLNHVEESTAESMVGLRCSGYPPRMSDCAAQLKGVDAALVDGALECGLGGTSLAWIGLGLDCFVHMASLMSFTPYPDTLSLYTLTFPTHPHTHLSNPPNPPPQKKHDYRRQERAGGPPVRAGLLLLGR
jgi:hypothetical protein